MFDDLIRISTSENKYLTMFAENLNSGIDYYNELFTSLNDRFNDTKSDILKELERSRQAIHLLRLKIENQAIKVVS